MGRGREEVCFTLSNSVIASERNLKSISESIVQRDRAMSE